MVFVCASQNGRLVLKHINNIKYYYMLSCKMQLRRYFMVTLIVSVVRLLIVEVLFRFYI